MKSVAVLNLGSSRTKKHAQKIRAFYAEKGLELFEIADTDKFDKTIKKALKSKPERLIICGGDGTVIGVIEHARSEGLKCSFSIVPTGTANYLARNAGVDLDIKKALKQSLSQKTRRLYLATANDKTFALALKIGVVAETVDTTSATLKRKIGQASYIVSALKSARTHSKFEYRITGGTDIIEGQSHQILIVNASLSDALHLAPDASMQDQGLKLVVYKARNIFTLTYTVLAYILSLGRIHNLIIELEGNSFTIETKAPRKVAIDGDVRMQTPVIVSTQEEPVSIAY